MRRTGWIALLALSLIATACGDDGTSNNTTTNNTTNNADAGNNATSADSGDTTPAEVVVGSDCAEGCGDGFCATVGEDEYCSKGCSTDDECPTDYVCLDGGPSDNPTFCGTEPEVLELAYTRPRNGTVLNLDVADITLSWVGGQPPYAVEFGPDEAGLERLGQVMNTDFLVSVADEGIVADSSYAWRVTSGVGTPDEVVGDVWTFETVQLQIDACPDVTMVTQDQRTFGTQLVGTTCWLDGNLTIGLESGGRTVNDEIIEKLCPQGDCETRAYYTGWELFQFYVEDVGDLAEGAPVLCPDGWELPTQTQMDELAATLSSQELAGFFPLNSSRVPVSEPLVNCIVTGEFELCTTFLDPEGQDATAKLWIAGTPTDEGLDYAEVANSGGTWGVSYGKEHPSHGLSVRCVQTPVVQ